MADSNPDTSNAMAQFIAMLANSNHGSLQIGSWEPIGGWPAALTTANNSGWSKKPQLYGDANVAISAKSINASQADVLRDIHQASQLTGCDESVAIRIAHSESSFKADAHSGGSSAAGVFQITTGTAQGIINRILPQVLPHTPEGEKILQELRTSYNPYDPRQNAILGTALIKYNTDKISGALGHQASPEQIYMMHFSPKTALDLARNPAMRGEAIPPSITGANPSLAGKTYGDLEDMFQRKMSANVDDLVKIADGGSVETAPASNVGSDRNSTKPGGKSRSELKATGSGTPPAASASPEKSAAALPKQPQVSAHA